VDTSTAGNYTYKVTCDNEVCPPEEATGTVTVVAAPTANFTGSPTSGCAPLTVVFTDLSTGNATSWSWNFTGGDPASATGAGPHTVTYNSPGTYTVSLTVSNDCGSDTETKTEYITAEDCTPAAAGGIGCPTTRYLTVDWEGNNTTKPLYSNNRLAVDLLGPSTDGSHSLLLERGTLAPTVRGKQYYLIVIREIEEIPPLPENTVALVAVNVTPAGAVFDRNIFLTLGLDQLQLPENALNVTMDYYDDINGVWVPLEFETGGPNGVAELTLSAPIDHFSIFGVLAELAPTPTAHFVPSGLSIVPTVEKIWEPITFVTKTGESVTITANVANYGGQEGAYTVELKLNGETIDTRTLTLGAGQSQPVSFTKSGLDYGQYEVDVAGLHGEFTTSRTITWWLIIVIIAAIGLIIWGVFWGRKRRKATQEE
jgi:PKD repeat protein